MENKLIHLLNKPRSKQKIEVWIDYEMDPDGWFLDIQYIEKKTNKLAHKHCIILKDFPNWFGSIIREGWIEIEIPKNSNI